ncbi:hypothetical protein SM73_05005 [Klebsiella quasipneumoniae]|nr:hypothetical protein SM73_05005 [Klebsiella quasipneumoniae]
MKSKSQNSASCYEMPLVKIFLSALKHHLHRQMLLKLFSHLPE